MKLLSDQSGITQEKDLLEGNKRNKNLLKYFYMDNKKKSVRANLQNFSCYNIQGLGHGELVFIHKANNMS